MYQHLGQVVPFGGGPRADCNSADRRHLQVGSSGSFHTPQKGLSSHLFLMGGYGSLMEDYPPANYPPVEGSLIHAPK